MQYVEGKSNLVGDNGVLTVPASALGLTGPEKIPSGKNVYKSGSISVFFSKGAAGIGPAPPKDELIISARYPNPENKELDQDERNAEFDTAEAVAEAVGNLKGGKRRRRKTRKSKKSKKGSTRRR